MRGARPAAAAAQRRRPAAHHHLPVPALRRLDSAPPQARGFHQLLAVAGDPADHRRRAAVGQFPALRADPGPLHQVIYDLGNIALLAGILLFPYGRLQPPASSLSSRPADPVPAEGRSLPPDLHPVHGRLRNDPGVAAAGDRGRRHASADQMGAVRFFGLRAVSLVALAIDMGNMARPRSAPRSSSRYLAALASAWPACCRMMRAADRAAPLPPLRRRDDDQPVGEFRADHFVPGRLFAAANEAVKECSPGPLPARGRHRPASSPPPWRRCGHAGQEQIINGRKRSFSGTCSCCATDLPECIRDLRETASLPNCSRMCCADRAWRAGGALRGDRQWQGAQYTISRRRRRSLGGHDRQLAEQDCEAGDKFPVRVSLCPAHGDTPLGFILSARVPTARLLARTSKRRFPRCPKRLPARSATSSGANSRSRDRRHVDATRPE